MANPIKKLDELLSSKKRLLLDGSMGQELLHRGITDDPVLWSAHALGNNANVVQALHAEYIDAGADIITTNTYATNVHRFSAGRRLDQFERLNRLAGEVARNAIDASGRRDVLLAASLPPMRDSYRPDRVLPYAQMLDEYAPQAEILAEYVDVFLCETMSSAEEGRAAATAALAAADNQPVWVSWTLRDDESGLLRSGETLAEAVAALDGLNVGGYLVNCSAPESITAAMPGLCRYDAPLIGAYANGFLEIPETRLKGVGDGVLKRRLDLDPGAYAMHAERWLAAGANVIGGCCEVGPDHIARLRELV